MRVPLLAVTLFSLTGLHAWGDTPVTANQGAPGKQGCWPVCMSGSVVVVGLDGGVVTVNGTVVVIGPDGGSVPVNITQSVPIQVFMDGGQHVIADQGAPGMSPWACYVAMDGGQQITVNQGTTPWNTNVAQWGGTNTTLGQKTSAASVPVVLPSDQVIQVFMDGGQHVIVSGTVQVFMDGGQHVIADQGTSPWACYVAMDGGQQITVNQGTSPWVVSGTVQVFMDGGQHVIADQGTNPWTVNGTVTANQGTSPWACYVATDGGQHFIVDQGTTPWVVTNVFDGGFLGTVNVAFDGGYIGTTGPVRCSTITNTNTTVGLASTAVPAAAQAGRIYVTICNSSQNVGLKNLKCRADGVAPVFAIGNAGDFLEGGDCVQYAVNAAQGILCISNNAATNVTGFECTP